MLHLCGSSPRLCDAICRREFLRAGGLALADASLMQLLESQAAAGKNRFKSVIQLYLWGG